MGIDLPSVRLVIESLRIRFCQRIFLGTFEAAIAPSLMLSSSRWYTKSDQAPRFSIWFAGLGLGQIIGGMLLYAFQQVKDERKEGLEGWRIILTVVGIVTVVFAVVVGVRLDAGAVLGEREKVVLLRHVAVNRIRIRNGSEVVLDGQLWFMTLLTILVCVIGFRRYLIADLPCGLDLNLRRRTNNVLRNPHINHRLLLPELRSSQHFLRSCLHCQHPHRWLRHPLHLAPLGLARRLLYTRHPRRRTALLRYA